MFGGICTWRLLKNNVAERQHNVPLRGDEKKNGGYIHKMKKASLFYNKLSTLGDFLKLIFNLWGDILSHGK
jgi:hypothetical protein